MTRDCGRHCAARIAYMRVVIILQFCLLFEVSVYLLKLLRDAGGFQFYITDVQTGFVDKCCALVEM